ncbi:type II toxin-antitoxin system VapC family toxin [Thermococcus sp.]
MRAFYDTNIFLKFLGGEKEAGELLDLAFEGTVKGVINWVVVSEVTFGYLKLLTGLRPYDLRKKLSKLEIDLSPIEELLKPFEVLNIGSDSSEIINAIQRFGLLPNDALIALTCIENGISTIVSFDSDFDKVANLKRVTNPDELKDG